MANDAGSLPTDLDRVDILIVDDLQEKLLVLQAVLQDLDQNLVLARSGAEALREVLKREFAVILLDVNMPDIDGLEAARLIRSYRKSAHTPIIFITAYADEMQTLRGYALGAVDYIHSPVVPEVLRGKVRVFVELYRMQRSMRQQAEERIALARAEAARIAAEEQTRRQKFLARAGHELSGSLDRSHSARRLLELVVPELAALALLVERDDSAAGAMLCAASEGAPLRLRSGVQVPEVLAAVLAGAMEDGGMLRLGPELLLSVEARQAGWLGGLRHALVLPLRSGARCLGALLVAAPGAFEPGDTAVLEELASRAATAFENARLYGNLQAEIVERQEAEFKLEETGRRKDEFLAMLSHELRNPLAPIRNAVEVLRRTGPREESLCWARDVIERQVTHLTRLVDDLLDVARIVQGKVSLCQEPVALSAVLEQAVEIARPLIVARRHELIQRPPPAPVSLYGDPARLAQAVSNLLNNAAKYTPEGGRIELSSSVRDDSVLISVRDNGIGIEAGLLGQVFDLFIQGQQPLDRNLGGLGVGLTLVRQLVQLHGGRVEARSGGAGQGAEFVILLPLRAAAAAGATGMVPAPAPLLQARRVLVVDDNQDAAESIAAVLELEGHQVQLATDGVRALRCAHEFAPEVVLLDIGLPNISGYEIARQLRGDPRLQHSLLIALTGYGQPEDLARTAASGFHQHFIKPVEPRRIVDAIAAWMPPQLNRNAMR